MRKAKIICTLGPASQSPNAIGGLIRVGMDMARLNFSHGTPPEHQQRLELVRRLAKKLDRSVAVLQDIQGPRLRVGQFTGGQLLLRTGERVVLTTRSVLGAERAIPTPNRWLPQQVKPGESILIDDGKIRLRVIQVRGHDVVCAVLRPRKHKSNVDSPRLNASAVRVSTSCPRYRSEVRQLHADDLHR